MAFKDLKDFVKVYTLFTTQHSSEYTALRLAPGSSCRLCAAQHIRNTKGFDMRCRLSDI